MTAPVNIVMLTKNRLRLLSQALWSLKKHTPPELYTFTLIDDDSSRETFNAVNSYLEAALPDTAVVHLDRSRGITGQARNLGVYWSEKFFGRGEFLYLADNDVYFAPNWLETLLAVFPTAEKLQYRLISGGTHPFHGWSSAHQIGIQGDYRVSLRSHDAVSGYSHLMRWEVWDKYGPLDAHAPGTSQSEDFKFCQQIVADGFRVGSIWPEVVYNCGCTNTSGSPTVGAERIPRYPGVIYE